MRARVGLAGTHPRGIGAIAGLAPALMVLGLFVLVGSLPNREAVVWLVGITGWAIGVGWLIGPLARGSLRAELGALIAYALATSGAYLLVGSVLSIWTESSRDGSVDLVALGGQVASRLLYGLLYLPFYAGFASPLAGVWVLAVRALRRRAGLDTPRRSSTSRAGGIGQIEAIRWRRIALISAAIVIVYGLFVAILPLILYQDPRPPWWMNRPIALFSLFSVPAAVAVIGARCHARPLLVTAGIMCLFQSYIAFSGVTLGFLVPAIALLWAAGAMTASDIRPTGRAGWIAGFAVIALTVAAWAAVLGMTEPRCWSGEQAVDGTITITEVPASDAELHGSVAVSSGGSGCSSAELTIQGMSIGAIVAIGAVAVAAASTAGGHEGEPT